MAENFKDTLNLPETDFPMRANLPQLEPEIMKFWEEIGLYEKLMARKADRPAFILHDGPPYANGDIHVGHALNKVLKDLICRAAWMKGYYAPYVPGWDCHGQPIEQQVEKQLGEKKKEIDQAEFRRLCKAYAEKYIDRQREQFKRLGVLGTWNKPYLTMDREYEATNVRVFADLYSKGYIYKGKKPIYWCYTDKTALAEAEIEYYEKKSHAIKVLFEMIEGPASGLDKPVYGVIWTTTPWTLPANVALAFSSDAEYGIYEHNDKYLILAEGLAEETLGEGKEPVAKYSGRDFEGAKFRHTLYDDRISVGVVADYVELSTGTGIVHIAPGHGEEDYLVGLKYNLPVLVPVDDDGRFTAEAREFAGLRVDEGNEKIIEVLENKGHLLEHSEIEHSYPHCWRCKNPVIFRATEQWFINVNAEDYKRYALEAIRKVKWIPDWSINRITSMVEQRPDWCISRQRAWGVPIPVIYCSDCGEVQSDRSVFERIEKIFAEEGADSWFIKDASYFLDENYRCLKCGSNNFRKETDIFDVWFESGISHFAVCGKREELSWPADLYLEGSDQHRGWFQSSLLTSVGVTSEPPYRQVLTHGFIVDEEGRKMSKSLGNVVDPLEVVSKMGSDVLRLWVVASDYSTDIAVSSQILERIADIYRRIRNTIRFMLGNLYDFDPKKGSVGFQGMDEVDKYILMKFKEIYTDALSNYDSYRFHHIVHSVHNFCAVDLSSFYLDVLKDRLYADRADDAKRRSTQTAIYHMLRAMLKLLAPIIPFTTEQAWKYLPGEKSESIHLEEFENLDFVEYDEEFFSDWQKLIEIRREYMKAYEEAKSSGILKTLMEAEIAYVPSVGYRKVIERRSGNFYLVFTTRNVTILEKREEGYPVEMESECGWFGVRKTSGEKCLRCWNWSYDVSGGLCERCRNVLQV